MVIIRHYLIDWSNAMAFFELRQYKIRPGKMAQWLDFMENEIIPFQVSKGAVTVSYTHLTLPTILRV